MNVANDTTRPTVTLTSSSEGATITETITLDASASDDVGVVGVQFTLDGVPVGAERTEAPYTLEWNSATVPNGPYLLAAIARDAAGNRQTATNVTVIVANITPPQP